MQLTKKLKSILTKWSEFFKEKTDRSMMRLLSFMCIVGGFIYIFFAHVYKGQIDGNDVMFTLGVMSLGITGKAYQKSKELQKKSYISEKSDIE